jgi:Caspase domain
MLVEQSKRLCRQGAQMMCKRGLLTYFCAGLLALCACIQTCSAASRVALVVGNSQYQNTAALSNPANDATDVGAALEAIGFKVMVRVDATKRQMDQAIEQFARDANSADAALFYYAGHGMQYEGRNYLVPVDAELRDEVSVHYELTSIDDIKLALQQSKGVRIVILDSCRNNPLAERLVRSLSLETRELPNVRGLAPAEAVRGMLIVYATQADEVANDGSGRNSPFTSAFLREIREPGLEIGTLFRRIGEDVFKATNGAQSPEVSISLLSEYYLNQSETDQSIWARIRGTTDPSTIEAFLRRYPNSFYAPDAVVRLDWLRRQASDQAKSEQIDKLKDEADRLRREQLDREAAAKDATTKEQELSAKLAAAEAARAKLAAELSQSEPASPTSVVPDAGTPDHGGAEPSRTSGFGDAQTNATETANERAPLGATSPRPTDAEKKVDTVNQQVARLQQEVGEAHADAEAKVKSASVVTAVADIAGQKAELATTTNTNVPVEPPVGALDASLVGQIRNELRRLGCFSGNDAGWSSQAMRLGVVRYAQFANIGLPGAPTEEMLGDLKSRRDRVCPELCTRWQVSIGDRCVAKTCGPGEVLDRTGACILKPTPKEVAVPRKIASEAPARPAGARPKPIKGRCFVFNGSEFCE